MGKSVTKTFTATGPLTWVCPAGVTSIVYRGKQNKIGIKQGLSGIIDPNGNVYVWGVHQNGGLGIGDSASVSRSSAVAVLSGLNAVKASMTTGPAGNGRQHLMILTENGQIYMCGTNTNGELGVGDVTVRSSPVAVIGNIRFKDYFQGVVNHHGMDHFGNAYGWGGNANGQLGVGDVTPRSSPVAVLGGQQFKKIITHTFNGNASTWFLNTAGAMYACGFNANGQLGVGDVTPRSSPVAVLGGLTFTDFTIGVSGAGLPSVHALTSAGAMYSFGANISGQLGVGDVVPRSSPVAVLGGLTFASIYGGMGTNVYMLNSSGAAYAMGLNSNGQLGDGTVVPKSSPVAVLGGLAFSKLVPGVLNNGTVVANCMGLTTTGFLYSWGICGNVNKGSLGVGDNTPRSSPVAVVGPGALGSFIDIVCAMNETTENYIGISALGTVYAWGENTIGGVGDGTNVSKSSPVAVVAPIVGNTTPKVFTDRLTVVPGTTYAVNLASYQSTFGANGVGTRLDSLTIQYEQP